MRNPKLVVVGITLTEKGRAKGCQTLVVKCDEDDGVKANDTQIEALLQPNICTNNEFTFSVLLFH